jgi:hypothetical protein
VRLEASRSGSSCTFPPLATPLPVADSVSLSTLFESGNYAAIALGPEVEGWEYYAAHGLIGNAKRALDGLARFSQPEARFYSAAACWIDGDDRGAAAFLQGLDSLRAKKFRSLVLKPEIPVLAQMPPEPGLASSLLQGAADGRFVIRNLGGDIHLPPYADIHRLVPAGFTPDFFICREIEWMPLAHNLNELACPLFGHTEDYDIHCQAVLPSYRLFDEIITCGPYEWQSLNEMLTVPVSTFPKAYGLPAILPARANGNRDIDLFLSGTMVHPYHPDKARFIFDLLGLEDDTLKIKVVAGHLAEREYWELVARSKMSVPYVRFDGSMPTRGLEALAMGSALALQAGSVLRAYVGENEGVFTYTQEPGDLSKTVVKISREWHTIKTRATLGGEYIRKEFNLRRVSSQYLRYLTFLASKSYQPRQVPLPEMMQKRTIFHLGWFHSCAFYNCTMHESIKRHRRLAASYERPHFMIDIAREALLGYAQSAIPAVAAHLALRDQSPPAVPELLDLAFGLYAIGVDQHPRSLVMQFNWLRAALHFGSDEAKAKAIEMGRRMTLVPLAGWDSDVFEDVFPWDFLGEFFNYRGYFDGVIDSVRRGETKNAGLHALIMASVNYHLSFQLSDPAFARQAVALDPTFALYQLRLGSVLSSRDDTRQEGVDLLLNLVSVSIVRLEAWAELQELVRKGLLGSNCLDIHAASMRRVQSRICVESAQIDS